MNNFPLRGLSYPKTFPKLSQDIWTKPQVWILYLVLGISLLVWAYSLKLKLDFCADLVTIYNLNQSKELFDQGVLYHCWNNISQHFTL